MITEVGDVKMKGVVTLDVSEAGVATIALHDPTNFNSLSAELIQELAVQLQEVHRLVDIGDVQSMVLQAHGPHFCVGGGAAASGKAQWPTIVNQVIESRFANSLIVLMH